MVETKAIYLSVLETGLSCIAVNLPSLWFLRTKVKPESVLRSVRSMISLRSIRSAGTQEESRGIDPYPWREGKKGSEASSSQSHLTHPEGIPIETHAIYDIEARAGKPSFPNNVQVTKTLSQSSERISNWYPLRSRLQVARGTCLWLECDDGLMGYIVWRGGIWRVMSPI